MLMCLAHVWVTGFRANAIQPWLSAWRMVAVTGGCPRSSSNALNHMASFVVLDAVIYLASTVDNATVDCYFDDEEMVLPTMLKMNPPTKRHESRSRVPVRCCTECNMQLIWMPKMYFSSLRSVILNALGICAWSLQSDWGSIYQLPCHLHRQACVMLSAALRM